jgi:hypothetical protein
VYQLIDETGGDLSGTSVTSSAPVAVMAGNSCADVPPQNVACNTLAEEMTPTDTWGNDFLTEPLATRSGDTFRFMASKNGTTVDVDGSAVATLNTGQFYETILTSASTITANNPIQVMQYSNGSSFDGANADPFDITIPPTEQFLNSYTVATEPSGADPNITQNYLNIVAPNSEVTSIDLDGSPLPSSDFTPIAGSSYSGAQVAVGFGSHNISASLPFGLTVYGFGGYDGYGYPGGFTLSPIATVSRVTLAPTSSTYSTGSSACETATVTDQNGNPVSGVRVDFTVTGVNPNAGFVYSATNGTAQYCYTGTTTGTDAEGAAVGTITSNSATIKWTSGAPTTCPPVVKHVFPIGNPQSEIVRVLITGSCLGGATDVTFGTLAATSFTLGAGDIVASPPEQLAGTVDVTVTTPGGTSAINAPADQYTYFLPRITQVLPNHGSVTGGSTVVIHGLMFSGFPTPTVSFGAGNFSSSVVVASDGTIHALVPPHSSGTVDVQVHAFSGSSLPTPTDHYKYN